MPGEPTDWLVSAAMVARTPDIGHEPLMLKSTRDLVPDVELAEEMTGRICRLIAGAYRARHPGAGCVVCGAPGISAYLLTGSTPLVLILCCLGEACIAGALPAAEAYLATLK